MRLNRIKSFYAFLLHFCSEGNKERGGWPRPSPQTTCKGGRPRPRSPTKGLPATSWTARKSGLTVLPAAAMIAHESGRPRPARSQAVANLRQRLPARGSHLRLACGRDYRRWAAACSQAIEAKLSPARVTARRNTRRGGAHGGGAAHGYGAGRKSSNARPLVERLPTGNAAAAHVGAATA
ncbi:hypothetical protein GW17_00047644 [Ensete ventricosum]|nr:hypothetical protein GW17_00047644 [Ensete ventricosum]